MRKKSKTRLEDVADAAIACFIDMGFRRTQMTDIAKRAGTSAGTLYLYVESKEALLSLALMRAAGKSLEDLTVPVETPDISNTIEETRQTVLELAKLPVMDKMLDQKSVTDRDIYALADELYTLLVTQRHAILLLDQLSRDIEAFNTLHAENARGHYLNGLASILSKAYPDAKIGQLRIIARTAIEAIAWTAMHRQRHESAAYSYDVTEEEARHAGLTAFVGILRSAANL